MSKALTSTEITCIAGMVLWAIGECHTHVETQAIRHLPNSSRIAFSKLKEVTAEVHSLQKSLLSQAATGLDEYESRVILQNMLTQTGLSKLEFPEIGTLLNPSTSLPLQMLVPQREQMIAALPSISPAEGWLASGFGDRLDPMSKAKSDHKGLDISNNEGTVIRAPSNGYIRYAAKYGRFGNYVSIVHGFGIVTKYAHLKEARVTAGQYVKRGDIIALMGSTGKSTGTHLHYEVWVNDKPFNPYVFLPKIMKPNGRTSGLNTAFTDNIPVRQTIEVASRD